MIWVALVALLALAVAAAAWWRRRREPGRAVAPRASTAPFSAVEIRTGTGACEAARDLRGHRFLARQAPALPLPACAAARCSCRFVKLSDRRTEDRRLERDDFTASLFLADERRRRRERRGED